MNQCVVCVTGGSKNKEALSGWKDFLESKGFNTEIKTRQKKGYDPLYALYRSVKDGECNDPYPQYWNFSGNAFYRNEEIAKLSRTQSICPSCGGSHSSKKGKRSFCPNCKGMASKNTDMTLSYMGSSKKKSSKATNK